MGKATAAPETTVKTERLKRIAAKLAIINAAK